MQSYLVRLGEKGDATGQNVHELVGVFCARSIAQLIELVDEFCEPTGMEYAPLGPGGIAWNGRTYDLPLNADPQYVKDCGEGTVGTDKTTLFEGAELSERWFLALLNGEGLRWKILVPR